MTHTSAVVAEIVRAIGGRLEGRPLVVMLDVDGTLAPIAQRPGDARVPADTRAVIERLAAAPDVHVALVSGRSAHDATALVGVEHLWVLGNHGIEFRSPDGSVDADATVRPFEADIARAAEAIDAVARRFEGAMLENKRWTLSLHYRLVNEAHVPPLLAQARSIAEQAGLRLMDGKKILEVRPPVAIDKGTASLRLASRLGAFDAGASSFFAGDDRTDEDAFHALRAHSRAAVTVRVGHDAETHAEFRVEDTDAVRVLLSAIADRRAR